MSDLRATLLNDALKNLLDGIHAGRFVPVNPESEGFCDSLVNAAEAVLIGTMVPVHTSSAAEICDAQAARWRKEAEKHLPHHNSDHAQRDIARAVLCEDLAQRIRTAAVVVPEGYKLTRQKVEGGIMPDTKVLVELAKSHGASVYTHRTMLNNPSVAFGNVEQLAAFVAAVRIAPEGYKLNANKSVAVSNVTFWEEDMTTCPRGCKVQLLGRGGVAVYSHYDGDSFWTKWSPLPRNRS